MANASFKNMSDEDLMRAYQKGDFSAFEEIFRRYKRSIYSFILRYTSSPQDSEELFQDAFYKLHRAADSWEPTAKFSTWLYTIVRHLIIDRYRRLKNRKTTSMDESLTEDHFTLHDVIASPDMKPDQKTSDQQVSKILEDALGQINPDQREVFLMREKLGLKFEEIAEIMGTSDNTIKSRMRYAVESLRKILEKSGYKELNPDS